MASRKICVISLDHWNYDKHIIDELRKKGIESCHINFGHYKHKNLIQKITNSLSKLFLNKNPKKIKRQEYIIEMLNNIGPQDQILVINPDLIDKEFHLEIKKHTKRYIAYLYDSMARYPVGHLLDGIFDTVFSFDDADVEKYHFKKITNYIYLDKQPLKPVSSNKYKLFYIASYDNRIHFLREIAKRLDILKVNYLFIIIKNKSFNEKLFPFLKEKGNDNIIFRKKRVKQQDIGIYYDQTQAVLDLVRDNQSGLSFRIFEAMAYQKKIITSNAAIVHYDFYNPNNILVVDEENLNFDIDFFETPYQPVPEPIYHQYTLEHWVNTVFEI